jgi:hypothetical protein
MNRCTVRFSESPLGRFLQALELYILILYVLIATFYNMPVRASMIVDALSHERARATSSFVGINLSGSMRASTFRITPPIVTTPDLPMTHELEAAGINGVPTRLMRPDARRRQSTTERLAMWIQNRLSGRPTDREFDQQMLPRRDRDTEFGQMESYDYTDEKKHPSTNERGDTSAMRPIKEPKYDWRDSVYRARTPPTGTSTPQHAKQPDPSESSPSNLRESPIAAAYTPATSYVPAESMPAGPNPSRGPTVYSPTMPKGLPSITMAPIYPLTIRSLSRNPRPPLREPVSPTTMSVPQIASTSNPLVFPEAAASPSGTSFRVTREYGSLPRSLQYPSQMTNPGDESPIYSLGGIIASLGGDLLPDEELRSQRGGRADSAMYSPAAASFLQKQAELERTYLQELTPERSPPPQLLYGLADGANPSVPSFEQETTSFRSDFTLSNFPSPPPAALGYPSFSRRGSVDTRYGEVDLDDLRITLIPPRMPAAGSGRRTSFPSTTRGSDILQPRSMNISNGTQWDVTSFIGGALGSPLYRIVVSHMYVSGFAGSEPRTPLSAAIMRPESQGRPLSFVRTPLRRDTMDTQRLSMVIEGRSNSASTPELLDEEASVRDARIVDLGRGTSLSRARVVESHWPTTPSSVRSVNPQTAEAESPVPMPTPAERLAAFRARAVLSKPTLPSSPRPAVNPRAESPTAQERSSPLGRSPPLAPEPVFQAQSPQSVLQPQPSISAIQSQASGMQTQTVVAFTQPVVLPPLMRTNSLLSPPRGLRNLRIGSPLEQPQNENALYSGAFERPRPAPLVLANASGGSPGARAI